MVWVVWLLSAALICGVTQRLGVGLSIVACLACVSARRGARRVEVAGVALLGVVCVLHGSLVESSTRERRNRFLCAAAGTSRMGGVMPLDGYVAAFPRVRTYGTEFPFETSVDGYRLRVLARVARFDVGYGDRLRLAAHAVKTRRTPASLFGDGVVGVVRAGFGDVEVVGHSPRCSLGGACWRLHRRARSELARRLGARAGLALALVVAERGFVAAGTRDQFRRLGISHLLALSGMHLGIVMGAVWVSVRRVRVRRREWIMALALVVYLGVVGEVHSLRRAVVMALVMIAARTMERPVRPLDALGRALFALLGSSPTSIFSIGLQLSFAATLGVVGTLPLMRWPACRGPGMRRARGLAATMAAGACVLVAVAPLQLHYFGEISLLSPLATIVFLPAVVVILVAGMAVVGVGGAPLVGDALVWVIGEVVEVTAALAALADRWAPDPIALPVPSVVAYYAGVAIAWKGRRRLWVAVVGVVVLASSFYVGRVSPWLDF